ncbi:MAG: M56 family metallopeptidase, partial [Legionella sp.]|uniref:M56 family metallopeptidase n=1 Tax=Legionella sp. TaxID=459 RepID=UPI0028422C59|nr:M56 family metallopeptidase [Legionella sp.]
MNVILTVFNWVLVSSLKACLIIPVILTAKLVFKDKLTSSWHYFIWFLLLIRLIIPVAPGSPFSIYNLLLKDRDIVSRKNNVQDQSAKIINETVSVLPSKIPTTEFSQPQAMNNYPVKVARTLGYNFKSRINVNFVASFIWLAGVIIFSAYVIFINGRLRLRIWTSSQDAQESEKQILDQCKNNLNIRTGIPLLITPAIRTPVLFGFLRPSLLIPVDLLDKINANELKHIFLHELIHFKRKDYAVNGLMVLLKIIHWFNPLVWFGLYIMHQDSEIACDDLVLSKMQVEERLRYGYTIIHLLRIANKPQRVPGVIGIMAKESKMKKRIQNISSFKKGSIKRFVTGIVLLTALSSVMLTDAKNSIAGQINTVNVHDANLISAESSQSKDGSVKFNSTSYLLDIQGQNFVGKFTGKIMVVPDPSKVIVGFSLKNAKSDKTTSDMAKESKAVGAINAGTSN